jgi:type IV secretory pathway VirB10-like protein
MELKDAIFSTLQIFTVLMIIILTVSYISFKIRKKKSGNLEPYQVENKPKIAIKTTNKQTDSIKKEDSKLLSLQELREKEKQKERQKNSEKERQLNKERQKNDKKREKSRRKDKNDEKREKESKSLSRENRFQVLNTSNESTDIENKTYSRPLAPLRPFDSTDKGDKSDNLFDRYTNDDDDDFYSPKIPTKGK